MKMYFLYSCLCTSKTPIHYRESSWSLDEHTAAEHPSPEGLSTIRGKNLKHLQQIVNLCKHFD